MSSGTYINCGTEDCEGGGGISTPNNPIQDPPFPPVYPDVPVGQNGWTPNIVAVTVNDNNEEDPTITATALVLKHAGWIGGEGTPPETPNPPYAQPDGTFGSISTAAKVPFGNNGNTPFINDDDFWQVGDLVYEDHSAYGVNAPVPLVNEDGFWQVGDTVYEDSPAYGTNGTVVTIGENNNWFLDGVDTEIPAIGANGDKGASIFPVTFAVTNISEISGMAVGDSILNSSSGTISILGVSTSIGGIVKSTTSTTGTASGNIRGAAGANSPDAITEITDSSAISFETSKIHIGYDESEEEYVPLDYAEFTFTGDEPKAGATFLIVHESDTEPTFPASFKKMSISSAYNTEAVNYIKGRYLGLGEAIVHYYIYQVT